MPLAYPASGLYRQKGMMRELRPAEPRVIYPHIPHHVSAVCCRTKSRSRWGVLGHNVPTNFTNLITLNAGNMSRSTSSVFAARHGRKENPPPPPPPRKQALNPSRSRQTSVGVVYLEPKTRLNKHQHLQRRNTAHLACRDSPPRHHQRSDSANAPVKKAHSRHRLYPRLTRHPMAERNL